MGEDEGGAGRETRERERERGWGGSSQTDKTEKNDEILKTRGTRTSEPEKDKDGDRP